MLQKIFPAFLIITALGCLTACSDEDKKDHYTVVFYNTDEFYDTINDPNRRDEEYLPGFKVSWNTERYQNKLQKVAQAIAATDSTALPFIVGLAEIENAQILDDLIDTYPLSDGSYSYIFKEGKELLGLDVALVYRHKYFRPIHWHTIDITSRKNKRNNKPARPALYVSGILDQDSIHIFVNQWPDRWLGKGKTERSRVQAALKIKSACDSLLNINPNAKIIVMGDFNDNPIDPSLLSYFNADLPNTRRRNIRMFNMQLEDFYDGKGSYFSKQWHMFDQMIVSQSMIDSTSSGLKVSGRKGHILDAKDLLYFDEGRRTWRPQRTKGREYYGGASGHLPVYIRLGQ